MGKESTKVCNVCKATKPLVDFHFSKGDRFGVSGCCKQCAKARVNAWYHAKMQDPAYRHERNEKSKAGHREAKLRAIEYYGNQCYDCKTTYHPAVYDIHHLNMSSKSDNPSALIKKRWTEETQRELDGCVLLCANCHRERHYNAKSTN